MLKFWYQTSPALTRWGAWNGNGLSLNVWFLCRMPFLLRLKLCESMTNANQQKNVIGCKTNCHSEHGGGVWVENIQSPIYLNEYILVFLNKNFLKFDFHKSWERQVSCFSSLPFFSLHGLLLLLTYFWLLAVPHEWWHVIWLMASLTAF